MKSRYLLPLLAGLACLGCKKEVDPTTAMFNQIMGEYRFTSKEVYSYSGGGSSTTTTACDIPVTVERDGNEVLLKIGGTNPQTMGLPFDNPPTNSKYYSFSVSGGPGYFNAAFEVGTDNIYYYTARGGLGGGSTVTYNGKRQ